MKIIWFHNANPDKADPEVDRALVKSWVKDHEKELHEIYHLANDNEVEAAKIITGDQEIDKGGRIAIRTLELHFIKNLILVVKSMEIQDSGSYTIRRTATQLGYIGMPCCEDDCGGSKLNTKKEIK